MSTTVQPAAPAPVATADFGLALRLCREGRRRSQLRLAVDSGVNHSTISRLESGSRRPSREMVERLSEALCLSEHDHNRLLAAAGFVPSDPLLSRLADLLFGDALDAGEKARVRLRLDGFLHGVTAAHR